MNALITLLIWAWLMASSFIVSGNMTEYASPLATSLCRFAWAMLIMIPLLILNWKKQCMNENRPFILAEQVNELIGSPARVGHYLMISGTLVGFFVALFTALQSTTPLNTSVIYTSIPLIGVFISWAWLKIVTPPIRITGFLIGSIGAITILFGTQGVSNFHWNRGDVIYLIGCLSLAVHVVAIQKWGQSLNALGGAFLIMLFGTVWLLPLAIIWGHLDQIQWHTAGFWSNALYLTVFTTLFTFILQQRLVITVGANMILAFTYTIPVWVAGYTAFHTGRFDHLLNIGFCTGILFLLVALLMIGAPHRLSKLFHGSRTAEDPL